MKKPAIALAVIVSLCAAWLVATMHPALPPLKDGDLLFQTTTSSQTAAIIMASASLYTHVGIVKHEGEKTLVIEATSKVEETPLDLWLSRGVLQRVSVYRDDGLTDAQAHAMIAAAKKYYGRPYDFFFSFDNDAIYCSELPYLAFRDAGVPMGTAQKIKDLNADNWLVREIIEKRWRHYDACTARGYDFRQCYDFIMNQPLITPAALARDAKLREIYSNYPF